ncbi:MAG: hypothetical protein ICV68_18435 [Pyrinomonadaceae bacterium]|nr:hypothetical protein [Pyrinomonadaceae bacterium]
MRGGKLKLIQIMAIILVIGLALLSPLFSLSSGKAGKVDMNVPAQVLSVTELDRPRPEVRIERVLTSDEFKGFDPGLALLLRTPRESRISDDAPEGEQLASLSSEHGRVTNDLRAGMTMPR